MQHESVPPVGGFDFGGFRRRTPVSREWGFDRGLPLDRYYIEKFLAKHSSDIAGHVLEVKDREYTERFGKTRVTGSDVVDICPTNPHATVVSDLVTGHGIPSNEFDCVILTQTLQFIFDTRSALTTLERILKPGGVLLATFPGISHLDHGRLRTAWYWKFTSSSAQRLFQEAFHESDLQIDTYGNVLAATAFLQGLAVEELSTEELEFRDPQYELVISVRAKKLKPKEHRDEKP
jgi:SAM-dependent methyltransferase